MTIINDDSRVVNKLEASLTDNARVIIYNRSMFIVQATGLTALLDCLLCFVPATIACFSMWFFAAATNTTNINNKMIGTLH